MGDIGYHRHSGDEGQVGACCPQLVLTIFSIGRVG